ncbi:uncharacterized protein SAMN05216431_103161 [Ligilactobacillus sp. WC1T17]|uniref:S1 motif domain-containing protein n=1 Tax=Ligilactobacillus ruminis TaxID=1623 RepID=A0ABY1AAG0_9LACO|nr:uncharacterized protein SAMN05216431_103161 [Ligilactobacillus ruminis]
MEESLIAKTAQREKLTPKQVKVVVEFLQEGATVPFIARYRKEATGRLDEVQIRQIQDTYQKEAQLAKRKEAVINLIDDEGKLTGKLKEALLKAASLQEVEDLYLPYKKKRQTKAQKAKAAGLSPLATAIMQQAEDIEFGRVQSDLAQKTGLKPADILDGAKEIVAEQVSDSAALRSWLRKHIWRVGVLSSKVKKDAQDELAVYQGYYDFSQKISRLAGHQILALNRGEKQGILRISIDNNDDFVLQYLGHILKVQNTGKLSSQALVEAYTKAYKKSVLPAVQREVRAELTQQASTEAINVFGENLYHLLMQTPLKGKVVLGFDPGLRTGCKLAVVDKTGKFLGKAIINPHAKGDKARAEAKKVLASLVKEYNVDIIAIGNGTASRESEQFVADLIKEANLACSYVIVSEAGASVYSASEEARKEFGNLQVEERSAISIARRLQDPLAELIKIDPQSIGVGQYQHDLPQKQLTEKLDAVIETGVNQVGVNLNTASTALLTHISGLNATIAQNIVAYRDEHGSYQKRSQLKKVPRLGPKAYEQAAGFLRIVDGDDIFDNTDIHPESYALAKKILDFVGLSKKDLGTIKVKKTFDQYSTAALAQKFASGEETVADIIKSFEKPGRDLRDNFQAPLLRTDVLKMEDLKAGMKLQGTVRNVVAFGAFVDIGVKHDGLVHLSKMAHKFVNNPSEIVAVGDIVDVWVESVDLKRQRIQLTMLDPK